MVGVRSACLRLLRWSVLLAWLVVGVGWVFSGFYYSSTWWTRNDTPPYGGQGEMDLYAGRLCWSCRGGPGLLRGIAGADSVGWDCFAYDGGWSFDWPGFHLEGDNYSSWGWVSLWMPWTLASLVGGLVWCPFFATRRRRRAAGCCVWCGYDRAGLAAGAACPECGGVPERQGAGAFVE
jgi:hypothetical protein